MREKAIEEIHEVARKLLADLGPEAVTNSAIARAMGISTPALYRYYASHDELIAALKASIYRELTDRIVIAREKVDAAHIAGPLLAMCREMRTWAIHFPAEFRLLFTSPSLSNFDQTAEAGTAFGDAFLDELVRIWLKRRFPVPDLGTFPIGLTKQLKNYASKAGGRLSAPAIYVFLVSWTRLYGALSMEVLHQLDFAFSDAGLFFEGQLQELCESLEIDYQPPGKVEKYVSSAR